MNGANPLQIMEKVSTSLLHSFLKVSELCQQLLSKYKQKPKQPIQKIDIIPKYSKQQKPKYSMIPLKQQVRQIIQEKKVHTLPKKMHYQTDIQKKQKQVTKRSRKSKKDIDPNRPKKPASSYILFLLERKSKILQAHPHLNLVQISKIAGKQWKQLPQSKKNIYNQMFRTAKQKYLRDVHQYDKLKLLGYQPKNYNILKKGKQPIQETQSYTDLKDLDIQNSF